MILYVALQSFPKFWLNTQMMNNLQRLIFSQFQQHLRSISGLPLGDTAIVQPSVMINLLGEKGSAGLAQYDGLSESLKLSGVYPHIYGKQESKPFRKMGHVTVINPELEEAKKIALKVKDTIKVRGN